MTDPFEHQIVGTKRLKESPYLILGDQQGLGKTRQVIDACQELHKEGKISSVCVISPQPVKLVWGDPGLGELYKYVHPDEQIGVAIFDRKLHTWQTEPIEKPEPEVKCMGWESKLSWIICNYERIINPKTLDILAGWCQANTCVLVLDESAYIKSHRSQRTKAAFRLRKLCPYVWLLNGTPVVDTPADLYTQASIMDRSILDCANISNYRARYASIEVTAYGARYVWDRNQDDLAKRIKPHILRREKAQCLDLPEKMPSTPIFIPLCSKTWTLYKNTLKDIVIELGNNTELDPVRGGARALRLAQVTSGFALLPDGEAYRVSSEKIDAVIKILTDDDSIHSHSIVWCRFRKEVETTAEKLEAAGITVYKLLGGQKPEVRAQVLEAFSLRGQDERAVLVATVQCGKTGLNLTKATQAIYLSNTYSLFERQQSEDRIHRIGQKFDTYYTDIIATGPGGEKTIDHTVMATLQHKEAIESWLTARWIEEFRQLQREVA